jgi:hypothetical protein
VKTGLSACFYYLFIDLLVKQDQAVMPSHPESAAHLRA